MSTGSGQRHANGAPVHLTLKDGRTSFTVLRLTPDPMGPAVVVEFEGEEEAGGVTGDAQGLESRG